MLANHKLDLPCRTRRQRRRGKIVLSHRRLHMRGFDWIYASSVKYFHEKFDKNVRAKKNINIWWIVLGEVKLTEEIFPFLIIWSIIHFRCFSIPFSWARSSPCYQYRGNSLRLALTHVLCANNYQTHFKHRLNVEIIFSLVHQTQILD